MRLGAHSWVRTAPGCERFLLVFPDTSNHLKDDPRAC